MKKLLTGLLATSFLLCAAPSFADPKKMPGNDVYENTRDFRFQSLNSLKKNKRIMVPMIEFRIQNHGQQTATSQKSGGFGSNAGTATAHATAEVTVALDPALVQKMATQVHQDLIARLKAEGWEIVDINDYKDTRAYRGLNFEGESKLGLGIKAENRRGIQGLNSSGAGGGGYFVSTAEGTDFIKPKMGLHYNAVRGISKQADAIVMIPAYSIYTMSFDRETSGSNSNWSGEIRASASISAQPIAALAGAHFELTTPKGKLANIYSPINKTWGNNYIGELVEEGKASPQLANTIGVIGGALGLANTQRNKTNYVLVPDESALTQQTFRMTEAVNDIVARATGFYVQK